MLGLVSLDPVLVVGDARFRLATDEWANGTVDPRGNELLVSFDLEDGVPRWRWQIGEIVLERELAMAHGSSAVGVVHRLLSRGPAGAARAHAALHVAERARRAVRERRARGRADGRRLRVRAGLPRRRPRLGGRRRVVPRRPRPRGGGARAERPRGPLGGRRLPGRAGARRVSRGDRRRRAPPTGRLPAATEIVAAARSRAAGLLAAAGATDDVDAQLVLAADQFAITTAGRPTAVAGYPWFGEWSRDLMTSYEGLYPRDRSGRRGPRGAAHVGRDGLRGDAREHRRHRLARVQHGRRHAVVRPRARPPRRGHRRRRPGGRARPGARADRGASSRRDALRDLRRPDPTGCCVRARRAGR